MLPKYTNFKFQVCIFLQGLINKIFLIEFYFKCIKLCKSIEKFFLLFFATEDVSTLSLSQELQDFLLLIYHFDRCDSLQTLCVFRLQFTKNGKVMESFQT